MKKLVSIFGPGECKKDSQRYQTAERLGALLAECGFAIVTGGYEGIMEAASKGAKLAGGSAIGITADVYFNRGKMPNEFLTREIKVKSAVDRLMELLDLADAYIACGISPGTLVEVATAWDYMIKKFTEPKPLILLGKEWKEICTILFEQASYKGKEHLVWFADNAEEAIELILKKFGKQEKLPELSIL